MGTTFRRGIGRLSIRDLTRKVKRLHTVVKRLLTLGASVFQLLSLFCC